LCLKDGDAEIGPKASEVKEPELLVRDESLHKTGSVREWDKDKQSVHGKWLPQMYLFTI